MQLKTMRCMSPQWNWHVSERMKTTSAGLEVKIKVPSPIADVNVFGKQYRYRLKIKNMTQKFYLLASIPKTQKSI